MTIDTVIVEKTIETGLQLQLFQQLGGVLGVFIAGIVIAFLTMWVKSWKSQGKEEHTIIEKLTQVHTITTDIKSDISEIKADVILIKKTQTDHEKRLTGIETEHRLYSKTFCAKNLKPDETKEGKFVRVLVVDDLQENCDNMYDFFHDILPKKNGWSKYIFQVDTANTYDEGIEKLKRYNDYGLGLIDYRLSRDENKSGFALIKYCTEEGFLNNGENVITYSADNTLLEIPTELAKKFLLKPVTREDWNVFENRLKEII